MRKLAIFALFLTLAATTTVAQEVQEEPMYVSVNYIKLKPGMEAAAMAGLADHLEWHKSTGDTHYYNVSQVVSGPRTGQLMWSVGPMTGAQLDDYDAFAPADWGDWYSRGGMNYMDGVETIILRTMPNFGNPPPMGEPSGLVHVYEFDLHHAKINAFMEALGKLDEAEKAAGPSDDYSVWVLPVSGAGFNKRWLVSWADGWAETGDQDPEMQAKVMEAAGGEEAYQAIFAAAMDAVEASTVTTYRSLPDLSFLPPGQ